MTPETKLRVAICRALEKRQKDGLRIKWLKLPVVMGIESGTPDMLVVVEGRAFFLELKVRTPVTVIQQHRLKQWADSGATCAVVRSVDDALAVLGIREVVACG